jgi:predicted dehydrogenase
VKQVIQDARSGRVLVEEIPAPALRPGGLLVRTAASAVSPGTERSMLAFAGQSLWAKARARPDLVRQVWQKLRHEGLAQTYAAVVSRLDQPTPLGYSAAGLVLAVGEGAEPFQAGDRVACAGAGYAVHAEVIFVPRNLCVRIPPRTDGGPVPFEEAAFTTLGAIALQGVRLAAPTLGERVVVIGLGVIGQLTVQLLRAHGCAVLALDRDPVRVALGRELGADAAVTAGGEAPVAEVGVFTRDRGADAVLIAAATDSNAPVEWAAQLARRKGRVVVVGAVRMDLPRQSYYERELSLTVSCSSGPGRYDPLYEEAGIDYPVAFVRWTEQRNMEAFLDLLAAGRVNVARLLSHRLSLADAPRAYRLLGPEAAEPSLGIVLTYPDAPDVRPGPAPPVRPAAVPAAGPLAVAAVGAGAFARGVLFPALRRTPGVRLRAVAAATGLSAARCVRRFGFEQSAADLGEILADPEVQAVLVLTPHRLHAALAAAALKAGRHVFVEKPLCVSEEELRELAALYRGLAAGPAAPLLTVGFNRRFSPLAARLRSEVRGSGPLVLSYRVHAGALPAGHWLAAPEEGGRIVGEACHFIDLAVFLTGARPARVFAAAPGRGAEPSALVVDFDDGSLLTLAYVTSGGRRVPKERLEVSGGGRSWVLDEWRRLTTFDGTRIRRRRRWAPAKGHREELAAFVAAVRRGGPLPIPFEELAATTQATFAAGDSLRRGAPVDVRAV